MTPITNGPTTSYRSRPFFLRRRLRPTLTTKKSMALVTISGFPCSGKTTRARQLAEYLEKRLQSPEYTGQKFDVIVVDDQGCHVARSAYDGESACGFNQGHCAPAWPLLDGDANAADALATHSLVLHRRTTNLPPSYTPPPLRRQQGREASARSPLHRRDPPPPLRRNHNNRQRKLHQGVPVSAVLRSS